MTTLMRASIRVTPRPDAKTVPGLIGDWIEGNTKTHPQSGLKMRSPRAVSASQTATV